MHYRADIDGLRALAVLPVVLFHLHLGPFSGGFVGVDVFFVISGFLITTIIAREVENGSFSLLRFYERRIRRIAPAGLAMVTAVLIAGWFIMPASAFKDTLLSILYYNAYATNLLFWQQAGYFDTAAEMKPLLHTWSLSVEEQFYILFPLFLLVAFRCFRRQWVALVGIAAAGSFVLNCYAVYRWPTSDFYLIPFRAWELAIGAWLALAKPHALANERLGHVAATLGIGLIFASTLLFTEKTRFPGMAALLPCAGAALVIAAGMSGEGNKISVLLGNPVLRYIGLISYSLYLWHWPVLVFARYVLYPDAIELRDKWMLFGLMMCLAHLSWKFIETPFRHLRWLPSRRAVFGSFAAATVVLVVAGVVGYVGNGLPARMPLVAATIDAGNQDFNPRRRQCHGEDAKQLSVGDYCVYGAPGAAPRFALWGDSHGAEIAPAIGEQLSKTGDAIKTFTYSKCPSALDFTTENRTGCVAHNARVLEYLRSRPEIATVYLVANYHVYSTDAYRKQFETGFHKTTDVLLKLGKRVVVFDPLPTSTLKLSLPTMTAVVAMRGNSLDDARIRRDSYDDMNSKMLRFLDREAEAGRLLRVAPQQVLCDRSFCSVAHAGRSLYFDAGHLSMYGARYLVSALAPQLLLPANSMEQEIRDRFTLSALSSR